MKQLTISDEPEIISGLQGEIHRSKESRYDHRLHGVLLVAQGMSCRQVARLLGDSPRTVQHWVHKFQSQGLSGLVDDERTGRPAKLGAAQLRDVATAIEQPPQAFGLPGVLWNGKILSAFIRERYGIELGVRQCQRILRQHGFRLRRPLQADCMRRDEMSGRE